MLDTESLIQNAGYRMLDTECWIQNAGYRMLDTECWIHDTANDFFASIGTKLVSSIEQFLAEPVKLNFVLANITVERYLKYLQNKKKTVHLNYLRKSC